MRRLSWAECAPLRNDTDVPVSEVVQVYLDDPVAEVVRPVQRLIAAPGLGVSSADIRQTVCLELTGARREAGHGRALHPEIKVS